MTLKETAREDLKTILGNSDDFETIRITNPKTSATITVSGIHHKISLGIDGAGVPVNSQFAHVTFPEQLLIDAGYAYRNADKEIDLNGHVVEVEDSSGVLKKYVVSEPIPDESLGLLLLKLQKME